MRLSVASPERPRSPTSCSTRATPARSWASVEIDGIYRSADGGDTWKHLPALGKSELNQDIHGLTISPDPHRKIIATTSGRHLDQHG